MNKIVDKTFNIRYTKQAVTAERKTTENNDEKKLEKVVDKSGDMRYTKKARQERARPKETKGFERSRTLKTS